MTLLPWQQSRQTGTKQDLRPRAETTSGIFAQSLFCHAQWILPCRSSQKSSRRANFSRVLVCLPGEFHAWELLDSASARERSDRRETEFIKILSPWEDLETLSRNFSSSFLNLLLVDSINIGVEIWWSDDFKNRTLFNKNQTFLGFHSKSRVSKLRF